MRKLVLLASAAAMAAAMPALAKDHGRGKGGGGGPGWSEHRGGDRGHARAERRRGGEDRGRGRAERRWHGDDDDDRRLAMRQRVREHRDDDRRRFVREHRDDDRRWRGRDRDDDDDRRRYSRHDRDDDRWERRWRPRAERLAERRGIGRNGCPPGLARQNRYCMPPGQLRRAAIGQRADLASFAPVPDAWAYRFRDDDNAYYRYGDNNVYRIDRGSNSIASVIPLLASGLAVGDALPLGFDSYNLPLAYRDNYVDGPDAMYRYDDGAIYQVDPQSRMIESIVALLGGNPLSVGAPLPAGYDAYNLPLQYRDTYVDDADSLYRYSNGSIFEIDPQTMLVRALVEMIA